MSEPNKKRKSLHQHFTDAASIAGAVVVGGTLRLWTKMDEAADYVFSPEKRAQMKAARAENKAIAEIQDKEYRAAMDAVTDSIINHPAAPDTQSLEKIVDQFSNDYAPVAETLNNAISSVRMLMGRVFHHAKATSAEIMENGDIVCNGQTHAGVVIETLSRSVPCETDEAKTVWAWIYKLAASGQVPHLFSNATVEIQNGKLVAKPDHDTYGFNDNERTLNLWAMDKAAIPGAKSSAPPAAPTP